MNGYLIARDLDDIKRQVVALEADRDAVARLGAANRQRVVERYAWSVRARDWLAFIRANLALPAA